MPKLSLVFLCLFVFATLTGCITAGPEYSPPLLDMPETWNNLTEHGLVHPDQTDLSQWWQGLGDPLLSSLIDQALASNLDVQSAETRLRQARARRQVATADLFPTLNTSGSVRSSHSSLPGGGMRSRENYATSLDAGWELDIFGGARRGVEAAEAEVQASQARAHGAQATLAAEVAISYVQLRTLQERLRISHDNLVQQSETVQLTLWRMQAGLTDTLAATQAKAQAEQTRAMIPALETSLKETAHSLDILLAKQPGALHDLLDVPGHLPVLPKDVAVGIPADTLRQRPDLMAAERMLVAETARLGVAEAARYPSFKLSGSIGLDALTFAGLSQTGALASSLVAGITVPLFQGGRLKAQVDIQDAQRELALINYEQTVLTALEEVENALVALTKTAERTQALDQATQAADLAASLAQQRYASGLVDFQSVLDTQRSLLSTQDSLASARADHVLAFIRLYKALGGGWSTGSDPKTKE
ncbi:efflux transporter outer membrane subunit [Desulfovibrionales bacterium]